MHLPILIANAFTSHGKVFSGNPAAVVPLNEWLPDEEMQQIAEQNNLAETAFIVVHPDESQAYPLRWFTPAREVRLCGHATLASAFVLGEVMQMPGPKYDFNTLSGILSCTRVGEGWALDFPADEALAAPDVHDVAEQVVGHSLRQDQVFVGRDDAMVVLDSPEAVLNYEPNHLAIRRVARRGIILTAQGHAHDEYEVVSRCFYPEFGIDEDAVTGSAHTLIGPYWSRRLNLDTLLCRQASRRGGDVVVRYEGGERVVLEGAAVLYLSGEVEV